MIGWWIVSLLTVVSVFSGIYTIVEDWRNAFGFTVLTFVIPILLIGGFAFFAAKDTGDKKSGNE